MTVQIEDTSLSERTDKSTAASKRGQFKKHDLNCLNPRTTHKEFGGVAGVALLTLLMPATVLFLHHSLNASTSSAARSPKGSYFDATAVGYFFTWLTFCAAMYYAPFGGVVKGTFLRDETSLEYPINAIHTFSVTGLLTATTALFFGLGPFVDVYDRLPGLITASILWSVVQSSVLYLWSFRARQNDSTKREETLLALNGNSGNAIYDFFMGRELNPRIGFPLSGTNDHPGRLPLDLKYFCELRPGLIGWMLINLCAAAKQYQEFGFVTDSMAMVLVFQAWYVLDSHLNEECVLTTMDITTDGFGFMLTFGDLSWVPFTYSLQARYLALHPRHLGFFVCISIILLHCLGYYVFRSANEEKDSFRKSPDSYKSEAVSFITTKTGSRLLTSGWWGKARHINYLGDWILGLAWCLPCGIPTFSTYSTVVPNLVGYFYAVYFAILLIHRERRDDDKCSLKYGPDWATYKRLVKWRIVPGIY